MLTQKLTNISTYKCQEVVMSMVKTIQYGLVEVVKDSEGYRRLELWTYEYSSL